MRCLMLAERLTNSGAEVDLPLIRKVAATGKPMIISTGMATVAEIDETVRAARQGGCQGVILLTRTSTYLATPANTNLMKIPHMRDLFSCQVGLSDHTMGIGTAIASIALGSTVIEKHFTLSRADGGVDSAFSLEPTEMAALQKASALTKHWGKCAMAQPKQNKNPCNIDVPYM